MTENFQTPNQALRNFVAIAEQFTSQGRIIELQEYGSGNINHTFLVTLQNSTDKHFILQRLNTQVFCQPKLVMDNISVLTERVLQRSQQEISTTDRCWQIPRVLLTKEGQNYWIDDNGDFWRAISFIANSQSFDTIQDLNHAGEIGFGLGMFHNLINDLPVHKLADTLVGFHITPSYLQHYERVLANTNPKSSPEVNYCLKFISDRANWAQVLETAKAQGKLHLRTIHGDPKINNIMLDKTSNKAIAMVDLDTVKPGLIHYDIGDCLRSGCNPLGEETEDWEVVNFEPQLAQAILQGYLNVARNFLTTNDYDYIYESIRLLAFELGLRFFTDYLAGNVYFKANHSQHNLLRALVQFKLTESIESQATAICNIILDMR